MQEIQLIFNAGKGGTVSLTRITAIIGDRVGAMPKPTRKGYVFAGWYMSANGDPHAPAARKITAETVLDASLFEGAPDDTVLYAKWEKPAAGKAGKAGQKRSSLANQKRAIAVLLALSMVLVVAFVAVSIIVDIYEYDDFDGVTYTIKKKKGIYGLYRDGVICDVDKDGYYLTDLGTMLEIDPETGDYEIYAVVDTSDTEVAISNQRVLMFKQLTYDTFSTTDASRIIQSIEVHNQKDSYTVNRVKDNDFEAVGYETAVFIKESLAYLAVGCGYTLSTRRLETPVRLEDGSIDYSEYGLAAETRPQMDDQGQPVLDEAGNPVTYDYTPTWYTVTTLSGDAYTVTLGDATVSGTGYYARYGDRDTVYILGSTNLEAGVLNPIESLVAPLMVYPMSQNDFFQVSNFVYRSDIDHLGIYRDMILEVIGFDINTVTPDENGQFSEEVREKLAEYDRRIKEMSGKDFDALYRRAMEKNSRLITSFSFIDMADRENTLFSSIAYEMTSDHMKGYMPNSENINSMLGNLYDANFVGVIALEPTGGELEKYGLDNPAHDISFTYKSAAGQEYSNHFVVSKKTEDGLYYAFSEIFDMIVCLAESEAAYLGWEEIDWYDREYLTGNIAHVQTIKLEGSGLPTPLVFTLDNSKSDQSDQISSNKLQVYANGQLMDYTLTMTNVSGSKKEGTAVDNFRRLYQSMFSASMEGVAELTEEEMAALREGPEDACILKLTILADDGQGNTKYNIYRFYRYSERKAYMTLEVLDSPTDEGDPTEAQGRFYVLRSFCEKIMADANRFMNREEVIIETKN